MNPRYLVFLDIDGVFTSARVQLAYGSQEQWDTFDPIAVEFMNWIHDRYEGVEFMLISTWKDGLRHDDEMIRHWVLSCFRNAGFRGTLCPTWKSNPDNLPRFKHRGHEIKEYLEDHPEIVDFIIFDDTDYAFNQTLGKKRLVRTDATNGMLKKHMLQAKSIVGTWKERNGTQS
jgi:hypothetical protein